MAMSVQEAVVRVTKDLSDGHAWEKALKELLAGIAAWQSGPKDGPILATRAIEPYDCPIEKCKQPWRQLLQVSIRLLLTNRDKRQSKMFTAANVTTLVATFNALQLHDLERCTECEHTATRDSRGATFAGCSRDGHSHRRLRRRAAARGQHAGH